MLLGWKKRAPARAGESNACAANSRANDETFDMFEAFVARFAGSGSASSNANANALDAKTCAGTILVQKLFVRLFSSVCRV